MEKEKIWEELEPVNQRKPSPFESLCRMSGQVPIREVPSDKIGLERIESVYAAINTQEHESRRKRQDVFSKEMDGQIDAIYGEYCSGVGALRIPRLRTFLQSLHLQDGRVKATEVTWDKKTQRKEVNRQSIKELLESREIPCRESDAERLLFRVGLVYRRCFPALLWEEYKKGKENAKKKAVEEAEGNAETVINDQMWDKMDNAMAAIAGDPGFRFYDGHLIYLTSGFVRTGYPACSGSKFAMTYGSELKPSERKQIFRPIIKMCERQETVFPSDDIAMLEIAEERDWLYVMRGETAIRGLEEKDGVFSFYKINGASKHTLKVVQNQSRERTEHIKKLLYALCGGKPETVDALAALFAKIMDPRCREDRLTVIYTTQNVEVVQRLLAEVFQTGLPRNVNKVLSVEGRQELLEEQIQGEKLLLIEDRMPSPSHVNSFRNLVQGKVLEVQPKCMEQQHFHNRMQVVCVTDQAASVEELVRKYDARLVDLTGSEVPFVCGEETLLSEPEQAWFRIVFSLYGCKVNCTGKKGHKKSVEQNPTKNISDFLKDCCRYSEQGVCEQKELYKAYCDYYFERHGASPKDTSIVFGKRVRELCGERITYKTTRYGAEKKPQLCYNGLELRKRKVKERKSDASTSAMTDHLNEMEQFAKGLLTAKGGPGMPLGVTVSGLDK